MSNEKRCCPECNTVMDLRLGMYECLQCGYEETEDAPERRREQAELEEQAKLVHRKMPKWIPAVSRVVKEPKGKVFDPGEYDAHARVTSVMRGQLKELLPEKLIVLGIYAVQVVFSVFMLIPFYHTLTYAGGGAVVAQFVIGAIVGVALWVWALFCNTLWVKYIFLLISLASLTSGLWFCGAMLYYTLSEKLNPYSAVYQLGFFFWVIMIVSILTSAWIAWILKRDIEYLTFPS